jgi:hypothetical protein
MWQNFWGNRIFSICDHGIHDTRKCPGIVYCEGSTYSLQHLRPFRVAWVCLLIQVNLQNVHEENMERIVVRSKYLLLIKFIKCLSVFITYLKAKWLSRLLLILGHLVSEWNVSLLLSRGDLDDASLRKREVMYFLRSLLLHIDNLCRKCYLQIAAQLNACCYSFKCSILVGCNCLSGTFYFNEVRYFW